MKYIFSGIMDFIVEKCLISIPCIHRQFDVNHFRVFFEVICLLLNVHACNSFAVSLHIRQIYRTDGRLVPETSLSSKDRVKER